MQVVLNTYTGCIIPSVFVRLSQRIDSNEYMCCPTVIGQIKRDPGWGASMCNDNSLLVTFENYSFNYYNNSSIFWQLFKG